MDIENKFLWLEDEIFNYIIVKIKNIVEQKDKCIVAIDGKTASGKSTIANFLNDKLNTSIIHMDDFFLPLELRTNQRYSTAGGNVHYERFNKEVANNLKISRGFKYQQFNCKKMKLDTWHKVENKKVIIVEGSYSTHPKIKVCYDLKIFLDISQEEQKNRILKRNGTEILDQFLNKWIPLEEAYFKEYNIINKCDIIVNTSPYSK